jgi:hypothetical protein
MGIPRICVRTAYYILHHKPQQQNDLYTAATFTKNSRNSMVAIH